ncbi:MAG: protein phosphatase 2C domain-containing protein [Acidobacteriaceae bacterium]|nr:protein phosphatase 2C domain-containing protein [Acidobacteriaceae bacterium]
MTCPYCTAVLPDDDLFCEECGERLSKETAEAAPALCACGAPSEDVDEDGYCLQCGRRCRPAPGEHEEQELSADFAAVTDRGLHHARNEDRFQIASESGRHIIVICDGVSNSNSADAAADTASKCIAGALGAGAGFEIAIKDASEAVAQLGLRVFLDSAPSTTMVSAVVENGSVEIAWMGDSRAYWIAKTDSHQLTKDHSWLNEVVSSGELSYSEAAKSARAHAITRWMGADADPEMAPEFATFQIPGPGCFLLCTDGLWNYAHETEQLAELVLQAPESASALEIARDLVAYANEKGGADNVTVALLRFTE